MNIKNLKYKIIDSNLINIIFVSAQKIFSFFPIKKNKVVFLTRIITQKIELVYN